MERLTIETPHAFAAVGLSRLLEAAGSLPRIDVIDAHLAVVVAVDEQRLEPVLRIVQTWLVEEEIGSARLSMHDREFVLAA